MNCLTDCDGSCCKIKKSVRAGLKEEGYTMYRSEAHFSGALLSVLNLRVPFVQRIESGVTGSGIPDLWLRWVPAEMWAELKNDPYVSINDPYWKIKWRKGQQAWAQDYRISCGRITYTIVAMRDGFIIIPMNKRYVNNLVYPHEVWRVTKLRDILSILKSESIKINFN